MSRESREKLRTEKKKVMFCHSYKTSDKLSGLQISPCGYWFGRTIIILTWNSLKVT